MALKDEEPRESQSVILAATHPWPEVEPCLESLYEQAQAVGAEVIVADGDGHALPTDGAARFPDVVHLLAPGASVFQLRALAARRASGEIVAVTEDHCRVSPDWCAQVLEAHRRYPHAAAIGGVVENGAQRRLVDWACFVIPNGPFMRPLRNGKTRTISLQANISYKRWALEDADAGDGLGLMEMLHNRKLLARGHELVADDQLVVEHIQFVTIRSACAMHCHNGRSVAGFRLAQLSFLERLMRLGGCSILTFVNLWKTVRPLREKGRLRGRILAALPLSGLLLCCHTAGEFVGYLAGPGWSPQHLE
jgi:hypothetical protein